MKIFYLIIFSFFISLQSIQGQLISHSFLGEYSLAEVQVILDSFDPPPGFFILEYEVELYKIVYNTPAPDGSTTLVSGAVCIPKNYTCPLPIANYNHGTVHHSDGVPSRFSSELNLGLIFCSMGYVVTLPDDIGLGDSPFPYHPYIHGISYGMTTANMIRATRELSNILDFGLNDQVFLFGYSQGGYAAMASHKYMQENFPNEFNIAATAPMSGPYDVSGAQAAYITDDDPYPTPGYLPYVLLAYNEIYGLLGNVNEALVEPYASTLPDIFLNKNITMGQFNDACPDIPNQILVPSLLSDFQSDPDQFFRVKLQENDVHDWAPQAPVHMFYCHGDDQVSYLNTENALANFMMNGAPEVYATDFGNLDHGGCVEFCMIGGKFFFDSKRDLTNGISMTFDIIPETNAGAGDGAITVIPSGGAGNYSFFWETGNTGMTLSGLSFGEEYEITVMDDLGCSRTESVSLDSTTPILLPQSRKVHVFPNPASDWFTIDLPESSGLASLRLLDITGKVVLSKGDLSPGLTTILRNSLPSGIYVIHLSGKEELYSKIVLR